MPSITLRHTSTSGTSQAFTALTVKGFMPMDHHVCFPDMRVYFADGSVRKKIAGVRRRFTIDLGVITDPTLLTFLGDFLTAENQYLTYTYNSGLTTETNLRVFLRDPGYASTWIDDVECCRRIVLEMEEVLMISSFPITAGYGFDYGTTGYGTQL